MSSSLQELGGLAVHDDLAGLHDVAVVGDRQGHVGVLLDEQDARARLVDGHDRVPDLAYQLGGQAQGGLVQDEQFRIGHQRPPDGQHLLFAAGQVAGNVLPAVGK